MVLMRLCLWLAGLVVRAARQMGSEAAVEMVSKTRVRVLDVWALMSAPQVGEW